MYVPKQIGPVGGNGESVIVSTEDGFKVGRWTTETRPPEHYEIAVLDTLTGNVDYTSYFHVEDIYKNTEQNADKLRNL